jgi:predicted RNA-binding Zn-ribbon protein involved in translation (DUF1610 family)
VRKNKINLEKVMAALNTVCPNCGHVITPAEIQRIDFELMQCPKCAHVFDAAKVRKAK